MEQTTRFFKGLKQWARTGLYRFFRQLEVHNVNAIPREGPVIFVPTHQNAFIDAILVICTTPRNPWSIARASVFKSKAAIFLLTAVQIKPVFRIRDGFSSLKNNDAIMNEWTTMLAAGHDIIIFAEGDHNEPYSRGDLQRGFARMALKFQQQYSTPLTIIPVGINYEDHHAFRSRVLVNYGNPISVNQVMHASLTEREKLDSLVDATEAAMSDLALQIGPKEEYHARYEFLMKYRRSEKTMMKQLERDRELLATYPNAPSGFKPKPKLSTFWKVINPIVWIGYLLNIIPYSIIRGFIRKKVKEPQFIGSLKFAFGIFLVPLYYLMMMIIFFAICPLWWALLAFAIVMPWSGILATDILKR